MYVCVCVCVCVCDSDCCVCVCVTVTAAFMPFIHPPTHTGARQIKQVLQNIISPPCADLAFYSFFGADLCKPHGSPCSSSSRTQPCVGDEPKPAHTHSKEGTLGRVCTDPRTVPFRLLHACPSVHTCGVPVVLALHADAVLLWHAMCMTDD
jgi:hypothetical protein